MGIRRAVASLLPLTLALLPASAAPAAADKVPGDDWEATVRMSIPGMSMQMPPQTSHFCRAKNGTWDQPPMDKQTQERCKVSDWQISGNHATWKVTCQGGMSGTGDMTFAEDSYTATMNVNMEGQSMKMDMAGKKTGKDCDAMESVRAVERARQQAAEAQEYAPGGSKDPMIAACREAASNGSRQMFMGPSAQCKKPEQKEAFCKTAVTQQAYEAYAREGNNALPEVATFCGTSVDFLRKDLCKKAVAAEDLVFLVNHCEDDAKPFAEKLCAGRSFTSMPDPKTRGFCTQYAGKRIGK